LCGRTRRVRRATVPRPKHFDERLTSHTAHIPDVRES
jgi:hypothetical protein